MKTRQRWIAGAAAIAIIAAVAAGIALSRRGPHEVNLVLISVDTLRPDRLGTYGSKTARTPAVDRLASEGVVFLDVLASVPLTLPSHASMLTGLLPLAHGIRDNASFKLADDFVTLAEILRANSYSTGAAVGSFVLDKRFGLGQGFARYDDDMRAGRQASVFGYPERAGDHVTASGIQWLKGAREPFFLFLHYYDPHAPYEPPEAFRTARSPSGDLQDDLYDGEIAFADQEVGKVIAYLSERKLLERTLVVFTSDHGEALGEHGEQTHGLLVYDVTLRVPLVIRPPEKSDLARKAGKAVRGVRLGEPVRVIDILPTVLDILGLGQSTGTDGRSLVPYLEGEPLPPAPAYFEALTSYFAFRWAPLRGVRFNQWKYIFAPEEELYDIRQDPPEAANLAVANAGKAAELKALLFELAKEESEVRAAAVKLGPEEVRKLRALGYVSPASTPVPELTDLGFQDPKKMIRLVELYLVPGNDAFDRGDLDAALAHYRKFVEADPMNPEGQTHLARVLMEKQDYPAAIAAYNRVLEIDSTNSGAYFHLGNIAQAVGDLDAALACYQKALELVPGSPEGLAGLGSALLEKGNADSAIVLLQQAIDIEPNNTTALFNLGLAYSTKGLGDTALEYFRRHLEIEPTNVKTLANVAAVFIGKGAADSAVAYLERARDAAPGTARILVNLGGAYRQAGQLDKAAEAYEEAARLEPKNVLAIFGLAGTRASQGRIDEARNLLQLALAIDPTFQPAREAAARLSR